jgi:hypothetical protein
MVQGCVLHKYGKTNIMEWQQRIKFTSVEKLKSDKIFENFPHSFQILVYAIYKHKAQNKQEYSVTFWSSLYWFITFEEENRLRSFEIKPRPEEGAGGKRI